MPRQKPGPKSATVPRVDQDQRRKHRRHADFPLLSNFVGYHMRPEPLNVVDKACVFSEYTKWLNGMDACILTEEIRLETYMDEHSAAFTRQLLRFRKVRSNWDVKRQEGKMSLVHLQKSSLPGWSLSCTLFTSAPRALEDLPITRKQSPLGTHLDQGMFSNRTIFKGEIICEYEGTVQEVTETEFARLEVKHENDGNGILQLTRGASKQHRYHTATTASNRKVFIMNPYIYKNNIRTCATSPAVWANHCPVESKPGCNMSMITNGKDGFNKRAFLQARSLIPPDIELRWDYGIRDLAIPWTLP